MKCIFCKKAETEVINSRKVKGEYEVWRRRKCLSCKEIFTTSEIFSYDSLFVVKRNMTRKRFVYEKLFTSILDAVSGGKEHDRGDDAIFAKKVTGLVITDLYKHKSKYLSSKDIIRTAYEFLGKEDSFFALKYASYSAYRLTTVQQKKGK
jgi:transcriptional repressor NrdR